jgi:hypothetical protein
MVQKNAKPASPAGGGGMFTFLLIMLLVMVVYSVPFLRTGIADAAGIVLNPMHNGLGFHGRFLFWFCPQLRAVIHLFFRSIRLITRR